MSNSADDADRDKPLTEDEAFEIALDDHPELKRLYLDEKLPDEMTDANGNVWSPLSHLSVHATIEHQIANDEPRGMAKAAEQLEDAGVDYHEIRHLLGEVVANEIWNMTQEDREFDETLYMKQIRRTVRNVTRPN